MGKLARIGRCPLGIRKSECWTSRGGSKDGILFVVEIDHEFMDSLTKNERRAFLKKLGNWKSCQNAQG